MKSRVFINLIFLFFHKQKTKYISIFILATLTIFLLSTVIFIKSSLQNEILKTLESHNDFIIQKEFGGRIFDIENQLEDRLRNIYGVKNITKRVYGRYKFLSEDVYFTIIGVDFSNLNKELKNLGLQNISKDEMIVGFEVDNLLKKYKSFRKRVKYYIKRYYYFRYKSCKRYFRYKQRFFNKYCF